jgi:glycosyltransferase involved in cell wall biosynthesis
VFVDTTLTTPPTGGGQTFLAHLAPALRHRGHDVTVITEPGADYSVAEQIGTSGVRVLDDVWPVTDMPEERARRLAEWVNRASADAYVLSLSRDVGWLALPFLRPETRTAAVVHLDGRAFYDPLAYYEAFVDFAIGVSHEIYQKLGPRCGVAENRTRQIAYGVERLSPGLIRDRLHEPRNPNGLQIAYIGRIVQTQKRILDLPALVTELNRRNVPFTLHLIGDGEDTPRLAAALQQAKVAGQVRWWGWLAPDEVRARLRQLDALVLPSDVEGLPLVLLEAMGYGVVPVATRIPSGNSELVRDGENGFLAAVGDMGGFAVRLEQMHRDPELLARLRRAAWETMDGYSIGRMVTAYETLFSGPATRAPRPAGPFPVMPSCRSPYPKWLRRVKWRLAGAAAVARRRA